MTTIVAQKLEDGNWVMASDKRLSYHNADVKKIYRLNDDAPDGYDGALVGVSGSYADMMKAIDWLNDTNGMERPAIDDQNTMLVITKDGTVQLFQSKLMAMTLENADFFAVGSGGDYAMGALAMGASFEDAIGIAHMYDSNTGPDVVYEYLIQE